jgi:hypothetical protein
MSPSDALGYALALAITIVSLGFFAHIVIEAIAQWKKLK